MYVVKTIWVPVGKTIFNNLKIVFLILNSIFAWDGSRLSNFSLILRKLEVGDYSNEPKGIFYVSKLDSLEYFLSAMGFAKDWSPLKADNYRSMNKRQWKTSEIGSFAANIAAVFYK